MSGFFTVSSAARHLTDQLGQEVRPRDITVALYQRDVPDGTCPIVAGRRMVPQEALPLIVEALRRRGRLCEGACA